MLCQYTRVITFNSVGYPWTLYTKIVCQILMSQIGVNKAFLPINLDLFVTFFDPCEICDILYVP